MKKFKPLPPVKQFNKRTYALIDRAGHTMGIGDSLCLQDCFGYINAAKTPKNEQEQDGKMAALAFDMNCQLFKRIDTDYINPKEEKKQ